MRFHPVYAHKVKMGLEKNEVYINLFGPGEGWAGGLSVMLCTGIGSGCGKGFTRESACLCLRFGGSGNTPVAGPFCAGRWESIAPATGEHKAGPRRALRS